METQIPPRNGGFLILHCSDRVALGYVKGKDRWEIPGGGEELIDRGDLLETAIRETREELLLNVSRENTTFIGNLVQVIPGTGGTTGIAGLWSTQVFKPDTGLEWRDFKLFHGSILASTDETSIISLLQLRDIFCVNSNIFVPLGHKRMLLHSLNTWKSRMPLNQGIRLSSSVTAVIPGLGSVTC